VLLGSGGSVECEFSLLHSEDQLQNVVRRSSKSGAGGAKSNNGNINNDDGAKERLGVNHVICEVLGTQSLPAIHFFGTQVPYITACLMPGRSCSGRTRADVGSDGADAKYTGNMSNLISLKADPEEHSILLQVWAENASMADDFIAETTLPLDGEDWAKSDLQRAQQIQVAGAEGEQIARSGEGSYRFGRVVEMKLNADKSVGSGSGDEFTEGGTVQIVLHRITGDLAWPSIARHPTAVIRNPPEAVSMFVVRPLVYSV
jgi:hypothetical protein